MTKHISRVEAGDLVKNKETGAIGTVARSDAGACQLLLVSDLPTAMHSWDMFEHYAPEAVAVPPAPEAQTEPELDGPVLTILHDVTPDAPKFASALITGADPATGEIAVTPGSDAFAPKGAA